MDRETRADKLGDLRIVIDKPPSGWTILGFFCNTCGCGTGVARSDGPGIGTGRPPLPHGMEMQEGGNLVVPFDPLAFGDHLLHEIRPQWDRRWFGNPVSVCPRSQIRGLLVNS